MYTHSHKHFESKKPIQLMDKYFRCVASRFLTLWMVSAILHVQHSLSAVVTRNVYMLYKTCSFVSFCKDSLCCTAVQPAFY